MLPVSYAFVGSKSAMGWLSEGEGGTVGLWVD